MLNIYYINKILYIKIDIIKRRYLANNGDTRFSTMDVYSPS